MSRKVILLLIFISLVENVKSQLSDSLIQYYNNINLAECYISDSDYNKAIKYYNLAFKYKKEPFCKEKYNSAVCYWILNNKKSTYLALKYILQYGYSLDSLLNKKVFGTFFLTKYGKKLISFDKQKKILFDYNVRKKYDSIFCQDQYFRKKEGSYAVYNDTIKKIDSTNIVAILEIIEKYGYPSEQLIGVYPFFDFEPFKIIVLHNITGMRNPQLYNFSDILYKAVFSGKLDGRIAANLIGSSNGYDIYGTFFLGLIQVGVTDNNEPDFIKKGSLSGYGLFNFTPNEKTKELDKKRSEIGLDGIGQTRKKLIFQYYHPDFWLINIGEGKKGFLYTNEEDKDKVLKNLILLK